LIADIVDENSISMRKTIAGDAWDRAEAASCAVSEADAHSQSAKVSLSLSVKPKPEKH
jgi:tRNA-2-methylthio-N6-dimethylallyladenosine synthase